MKLLFTFKSQAIKAVEDGGDSYYESTCDIRDISDGASNFADNILSSAMGEVSCLRDKITGELLCAWWCEDEATAKVDIPIYGLASVTVKDCGDHIEINHNLTGIDECDKQIVADFLAEYCE